MRAKGVDEMQNSAVGSITNREAFLRLQALRKAEPKKWAKIRYEKGRYERNKEKLKAYVRKLPKQMLPRKFPDQDGIPNEIKIAIVFTGVSLASMVAFPIAGAFAFALGLLWIWGEKRRVGKLEDEQECLAIGFEEEYLEAIAMSKPNGEFKTHYPNDEASIYFYRTILDFQIANSEENR